MKNTRIISVIQLRFGFSNSGFGFTLLIEVKIRVTKEAWTTDCTASSRDANHSLTDYVRVGWWCGRERERAGRAGVAVRECHAYFIYYLDLLCFLLLIVLD